MKMSNGRSAAIRASFPELRRACPDLGGVLDIKQARISGYDWRDYLAEMGQSLATVHVSDIAADAKMVPSRTGRF